MDLELINSSEVARLLQTSQRTVSRWARDGIIPAYRIGRTFKFDRAEILAFLKSKKVDTPCQQSNSLQERPFTRVKGVKAATYGSTTETLTLDEEYAALLASPTPKRQPVQHLR